jgi:hypothetical protein
VSPRAKPTAVYLEVGKKRVFASALQFPGWTRAGKNEEAALAALAAYAPRYAAVAAAAGIPFDPRPAFAVEDRVPGGATTDFGAPEFPAPSDSRPLSKADAERMATLVEASWSVLDSVTVSAPAALRKGPRGGGRDRDKMYDHVLGAEVMYVRKLGVRSPEIEVGQKKAIARHRAAVAAALRGATGPPDPDEKRWLPRYTARRIAWHVLDHAWEMEDRSTPG